MYPNANIWLTGHSLGGGLAALLGATFGAPIVAFESPAGEDGVEEASPSFSGSSQFPFMYKNNKGLKKIQS